MKHRLLFALALSLVAILPASPALAAPKKAAIPQKEVLWDWWFVWAGGTSPSREVIYIDSLSVEEIVDHAAIMSTPVNKKLKKFPIDYVQADGIMISENTQKPAKNATRIRVKCTTQQIMFDTSYHSFWDTDRGVVTEPASPWFDANSHIRYAQIAKFMCDPKARTDENMMMRADQSYDPLDTTWAVFWKDATKPKFTTTKSREQVEAEFAATVAKAQQQNADATTYFTEKREEIIRDQGKFAMEQRALFDKMNSKASPLLETWLGADERSLVASWGIPSGSYNAPDARFLTYTYGYATQMVDEQGTVQPGSRQEFSCDMTFEIRNETIADYRSSGNYCESASSGKPRGPNWRPSSRKK